MEGSSDSEFNGLLFPCVKWADEQRTKDNDDEEDDPRFHGNLT